MSAFMRSTQATNSPRSVGRVGSRTRWIETPAATSSGGDSSPPRVRTCTSVPSSTSASESLRTWRASPPSIRGGYSQDRISVRGTDAPGVYVLLRPLRLDQRRQTEVRSEVAQARIGGLGVGDGLEKRAGVRRGALVRVVAGLPAPVEERPVARLEGEQLARRPVGGVGRALVPAHSRNEPQLQAPCSPCEVGNGRRVPGPKILALPPGRLVQEPLFRLVALERLGQRHEPAAVLRGAMQQRLEPCRSLRPPVAEQLRVDCEGHEPRPAAALPESRQPIGHRSGELPGLSRGALARGRAVVRTPDRKSTRLNS